MDGLVGYISVGLAGALVGAVELAYRYRDDPWSSFARFAGLMYVVVNAVASVLVLYVIRVLAWDFGVEGDDAVDLVRILVAGFGALALFRTKLFTAAQGEESVAFGPSRILEMLLDVSDRALDRKQATTRGTQVAEIMAGVSFAKAYSVLPVYALGLLEGVDAEEQKRVAADVGALAGSETMDDAAKALGLGAALIRVTGADVLRQAVVGLGESIRRPAET